MEDGGDVEVGLRVVVDCRERSLFEALSRASAATFRLESRALDVADVQILRGDTLLLAIERKTASDFASSVRDGRYHEQKRRLTDAFGRERVAYALEGRMFQTRRFEDWEDSRVRGCLLSLLVGSHRLPVVCTLDVEDTAAFVAAAATRLLRDAASASASTYETLAVRASSSRKRDNVDGRTCFLQQLCQIPGVSVAIANNVADAAGGATCMRHLFDYLDEHADAEKALRAIPLVGPKTAASILSSLFARPAPARVRGASPRGRRGDMDTGMSPPPHHHETS